MHCPFSVTQTEGLVCFLENNTNSDFDSDIESPMSLKNSLRPARKQTAPFAGHFPRQRETRKPPGHQHIATSNNETAKLDLLEKNKTSPRSAACTQKVSKWPLKATPFSFWYNGPSRNHTAWDTKFRIFPPSTPNFYNFQTKRFNNLKTFRKVRYMRYTAIYGFFLVLIYFIMQGLKFQIFFRI
jgi:hypothetical protein